MAASARLSGGGGTDMAKKVKRKKANQKKANDKRANDKRANDKRAKSGAKKAAAKAKLSAKKKAPKRKAARKPASPRRPARQPRIVFGSRSVETVPLKQRERVAAAGAGGGDFGGASVVENVDSESADELLEEGQAFEAGIVSGVENAPDPDQGEVRTREVPQDDVPEEYEDKDRP